ncbi:unnamed protein product [Tuber melanosporum]|uniref:(Perigord truffle) hypothetical protein n=1 Tax=Tuber melanosporum (strain Mel28) TaxID=656061 RepID=D5GKP8_TUBMM|nr:uncharacterized protein GSTUM_00009689001 [Tuber melanosporum]CAZ85091.1 unnamed protein product [Tuber melanosporum]
MTLLHLSDEGLDANIRGTCNWTPLQLAVCQDKDRNYILMILLANKRVDPNLKSQNGLTPFREAVKLGCEAAVLIFMTSGTLDISAGDSGEETLRQERGMREFLGCCLKGAILILMPIVLVAVQLGRWR